ncbi:MAG: DegT/DnrJ/EryC1/StrS family aminotransferase [Flavobacteriales bacterium]|nr:DegT/DnrJ/EryC1/StrS family aminotransferase [Flavobacteriales bacterium]
MIPFSPPRIDQKIIDEVVDTLKSGWITTGPKTLRFEEELTAYCGNKATICVGSATAGLHLVLHWLGVGPGDEVILPAYTYCATANVVEHLGATVVFADVNALDFNINCKSVAEKITSKTKVIMPVDIGGYPCDYEEIHEVVQANSHLFSPNSKVQEGFGRICVLADAAHSIGASYHGELSGTFADVSVFSFHAVKNLSTAEGGAIALNLPEAFDCEALRKQFKTKSLHGQSKDAFSKMQLGGWQYDVVEAGFKCNMTDIQASMGLVELSRYPASLERRQQIFARYTDLLRDYDWAHCPRFITGAKESSYHLYMLRIRGASEEMRNEIIHKISGDQVAVNVHYLPVPAMTHYVNKGYNLDDYPQAKSNYQNEISLPVYFNLKNEQVDVVVKSVIAAVESVLKHV